MDRQSYALQTAPPAISSTHLASCIAQYYSLYFPCCTLHLYPCDCFVTIMFFNLTLIIRSKDYNAFDIVIITMCAALSQVLYLYYLWGILFIPHFTAENTEAMVNILVITRISISGSGLPFQNNLHRVSTPVPGPFASGEATPAPVPTPPRRTALASWASPPRRCSSARSGQGWEESARGFQEKAPCS